MCFSFPSYFLARPERAKTPSRLLFLLCLSGVLGEPGKAPLPGDLGGPT